MAHRIVSMHTVVCDTCDKALGDTDAYPYWESKDLAEEIALEAGWLLTKRMHFCPECAELKTQNSHRWN